MAGNSECEFVWDESSGLYFHAQTGFYHCPTAGWYYSSKDGNYYTFENGNYVLLEADAVPEHHPGDSVNEIAGGDCLHVHSDRKDVSNAEDNSADCQREKFGTNSGCDDTTVQTSGCAVPPPSEWLEDTLIELYLSGYSKPRADCLENQIAGSEVNVDDDGPYELEEGEWIPDDPCVLSDFSGHISNTGTSEGFTESVEMETLPDEDRWRSQYGQATSSPQDVVLDVPVIDLWDWKIVRDGGDQVYKLVGRLVKPSARPHPSISGCSQYFKTAPVYQVHEDLVRVKTGKIYRLRCPCAKYLATINFYDSSNPTRDWGFPMLSSIRRCKRSKSNHSVVEDVPLASQKDVNLQYRDRAAERRALHQGFGMGPGQKRTTVTEGEEPGYSPVNETVSQVSDTTFGEGSYARKVLQSMGWHEGEGLGSTVKGRSIIETRNDRVNSQSCGCRECVDWNGTIRQGLWIQNLLKTMLQVYSAT
ncbi:hypothetical protein MLD38_021867 [Melastoma candidum]|uniref:Uncharacterized protein n=1 Tax=Melastoma candidum TaxID=119954 RepID=A0ACB9QKU2_9MYRT|nr:hypothetical protein MLD38_021867 [Melastoma candidum]